jgi:hypothetical protein
MEIEMKTLAIATALATILAGAAGAQTAEPAQEGVTEVDRTTMEMTFVTPGEADFLASRLLGTNITNMEDESIGEIEDLVIRNGNELTGLVVSVGGFLGIGERHVVVDPNTITISADADGDGWMATANTTREALEAAPEFDYEPMTQ